MTKIKNNQPAKPDINQSFSEISTSIDPQLPRDFRVRSNDEGVKFYEPPVDPDFLVYLLRLAPAHEQAIDKKKMLVLAGLEISDPSKIKRSQLENAIFDFIVFGNFYLEETTEGLRHRNARLIRIAKDSRPEDFLKVVDGNIDEKVKFNKILHGLEYAPESAVYGLPGYLSALEDILTSFLARKRRRLSYQNGANGGLLLMNLDPEMEDDGEGNQIPGPQFQDFLNNLADTKTSKNGGTSFFNINNPNIEDVKKIATMLETGLTLKDDGYEESTTESRISILNAHGIHPELLGVLTGERNSSPNFDRLLELTLLSVILPIQNGIIERINESHPGLIKIKPKPEPII